MIHNTQSAQISQKQDGRDIYAIMKTICPPGYHHNGFVVTHALGHDVRAHNRKSSAQCMSCHKAIVVITGRAHCFHDCIYIFIYILYIILYIIIHIIYINNKAIVVITGRAHCFHDCIYIFYILYYIL